MASTILKDEEHEFTGMSARIRAFDWSATPLGPVADWPASLGLATNICTHSSFPIALYWGPELRLIYNDAWAPFAGERHPGVLGKPAREVWTDIWNILGPQLDQVIATGRGFAASEQMLPLVRDGAARETFWNYSLDPIFDEAGTLVGIFHHASEITKSVIDGRRLSLQVTLADRIRALTRPEDVKAAAAALLGNYLGAARVGFAEIDEAQDMITVTSEWTLDPEEPKLLGRTGPLSNLPEEGIAYLRTGKVLALPDVNDFSRGSNANEQAFSGGLARAVISVPLVRHGKLRTLMFVHEPHAREWKPSEAAMARDVAERSWAAVERAESEQRLRDSEDHYRHAVELNPQVSWTASPDGQLNRVSRRWQDWTGTTGLGDTWAEGLHPDDRPRTFAVWCHSVATGEPYDIEHRIQYRDGSYRWGRSRAFPRYNDKGEICLWYGATEDIEERKQAEEHQRLLINELNHRVKNTLATVQAIAFQTLKGDISLDEARSRFEARLLALSRAHNLLTERNWDGASLDRVVAEATEHFGGDRVQVEGDSIWVAPRAALALALAFHELSTNAVKYGALSGERGKVCIRWTTDGDRLLLEWKEQDGPAVFEPEGRGFGSRLIERGLAADLVGEARLRFEPDGLRCTIAASLDAIHAREVGHD